MMILEGGEVYWMEFSLLMSFLYFAYSSIIMDLINKWRLSLDSVYQIDLEIIFQDILIIDDDDP
jgi:hypothetical protein